MLRSHRSRKFILAQVWILIDATSAPNAASSLSFGRNPSKYCTPLDFEMVIGMETFHPSSFGNHLEYEIVFSYRTQVTIPNDIGAAVNYSLTNIALEFKTVSSANSAAEIVLRAQGRFVLTYEKIIRHR